MFYTMWRESMRNERISVENLLWALYRFCIRGWLLSTQKQSAHTSVKMCKALIFVSLCEIMNWFAANTHTHRTWLLGHFIGSFGFRYLSKTMGRSAKYKAQRSKNLLIYVYIRTQHTYNLIKHFTFKSLPSLSDQLTHPESVVEWISFTFQSTRRTRSSWSCQCRQISIANRITDQCMWSIEDHYHYHQEYRFKWINANV